MTGCNECAEGQGTTSSSLYRLYSGKQNTYGQLLRNAVGRKENNVMFAMENNSDVHLIKAHLWHAHLAIDQGLITIMPASLRTTQVRSGLRISIFAWTNSVSPL